MIPRVEHDEAQALFSDFVDDELDDGVRTSLEGHLEGCASCREALDAFKATVSGLRRLSAPPPAEDILAQVQQKIRKRSRGRYFRRGFALTGYRFPYEVLALLMLLLLLVVYFGMAMFQDLGPVSRTRDAQERGAPAGR